jgi:hypothetical protein
MSDEKKQPVVGSRPSTPGAIASMFACLSMNRRFVSKVTAPLGLVVNDEPVSDRIRFIQFPKEVIDTMRTGDNLTNYIP